MTRSYQIGDRVQTPSGNLGIVEAHLYRVRLDSGDHQIIFLGENLRPAPQPAISLGDQLKADMGHSTMKATMHRTAMTNATIQRGSLLENREKKLVVLVTDPFGQDEGTFRGTSIYDVRPHRVPADHCESWETGQFTHFHGRIVLEQ